MLTLIVLGVIMIGTTLVVARKKSESFMPRVRSCSYAIAAACHRPAEEVDAFTNPVQWGQVPSLGNEREDVGHCSLSMNAVTLP